VHRNTPVEDLKKILEGKYRRSSFGLCSQIRNPTLCI